MTSRNLEYFGPRTKSSLFLVIRFYNCRHVILDPSPKAVTSFKYDDTLPNFPKDFETRLIKLKNCFSFVNCRKSRDLKTFVTAVIITVAVLDIIDVLRVLPVLAEPLFTEEVLY